MLVSQPNNVKVYNLSSGKSLPEWISDRKKRQLLKQDVELRRRIELIQDFDMPTASTCVKASPDGQYILTAGVYKPRIKCFDVNQLSIKFDRCFDSECVKFEFLAEDFSKLILMQIDRYIEFHAQYGRYYRTRMPKFGRDMSYHKPSCDLYLVGDGPEVYRLNLEQGRFLQPFDTEASAINVSAINPEHQLLAVGTQEGKIVCFDPRSRTKVGVLDLADSGLDYTDFDSFPSVTALTFRNGLDMAVGTSYGHVLLYDVRSNKPRLCKNHLYELPIKSIIYHKNNRLVTSDSKIVKIWDHNSGENFTSIEPGVPINDTCVYQDSGLIFLANEATKNSVYYVPALGQAPKWCSFLDNITEELEESDQVVLYDDYKFVTDTELENLGLSHLKGTNLLRAYMHGFFIDMRLYHKAKSIVEPFAYEEYRKSKIREKIEEERASRIKLNKMPKVNRQLAEKLVEEKTKKQGGVSEEGIANPLNDDRFAAMFTNRDFQVDVESEEYRLLHPVISKQEKERRLREAASDDDQIDSGSDEDANLWSEVKTEKVKKKASRHADKVKLYSLGGEQYERNNAMRRNTLAMGERIRDDIGNDVIHESGTALGSREMTFKVAKNKRDVSKEEEMKAHRKERKQVRRSAGELLAGEKKQAVYWRGKRVK